MARVTVEDCINTIPNRFDLVMLASQRARSLSSGAELLIDRDNDKNPVVALREIAEKQLDLEIIEETLVRGLQRHVVSDEPDEDELALLELDENGDTFEQEALAARRELLEGELGNNKIRSEPIFDDDVLPVNTNTLPSDD